MKYMKKPNWHSNGIWLLKAILVTWIINLILVLILVLLDYNLTGFFSKITFLETGITLLVGGAIAFLGSASASKNKELISKTKEEWSIDNLKKSEKKANKYFIIAAIMFVQSIIISILGF
jgi:hypothetical protein